MQILEPDYFPVMPDERVISVDDLSLTSNICQLEKTKWMSSFIKGIPSLYIENGIM